jgi:hypothetical protein
MQNANGKIKIPKSAIFIAKKQCKISKRKWDYSQKQAVNRCSYFSSQVLAH